MNTDVVLLSPEAPLTSETVKFLLQSNKEKYTIIKNESSTSCADWWKAFGYPSKLGDNGEYYRIKGFVTCFKCLHTFIYNNSSGTTRLKQHANKCFGATLNPASSNATDSADSSTCTQGTLSQHGFKKNSKLSDKEVDNIKQLSAQWICHDLRPFSTLDDIGFRNLAQELIRIGIAPFELTKKRFDLLSGHNHGVVDVDHVLRGRHTVSRTVYDLADSYRQLMKKKLVEPIAARAVTICPDFWSDPYRNISYLGLNISFVDAEHKSYSIDLFCRPFAGIKSSEMVLKVLEQYLAEFGIDDLGMVNIVSDRGSNFVAAFRDFNPLFCFAHRLNNIVKLTFFQNVQKKKKQTSNKSTSAASTASVRVTSNEQNAAPPNGNNDLSSEETSEDEEEVNVLPAIPMIRKKRKNKSSLTNNQPESSYKMPIDDIPLAARSVLNALTKCKKIVKYIKKSGLNKEIEDNGGNTVHQSISVRWLSMIESLKSILKSFKIIKKILCSKQQQKLITNIDEKIIKQIILILKPVKHVVKLIQTGNSPSLFMVLLSVETLRNVMSSYKELINYDITYDNNESKENSDELDEDLLEELEGVAFFWNRIRSLLEEMFTLDIRHYVATLLHPKYRSLNTCSERERLETHAFIRQQLGSIHVELNSKQINTPPAKKFKADLFSRFESANFDSDKVDNRNSENEADDFEIRGKKTDELDRYLNFEFDKSKVDCNPLMFWKEHQDKFPRLARYARCIHSIPATSASVERQFSGAGLVINERRTNINPEQLENILLIRSMQKNNIL